MAALVDAGLFAPGDRVLICYGEMVPGRGGALWHVRLVLDHVVNAEYVIATPDFDLYVEELSPNNADLEGVRVSPAAGGLPPGLVGAAVYDFGPISAADLAALISEGKRLGVHERAARGVAPPVVGGVRAAPPAGPLAAAFPAVAVQPFAPPGLAGAVAAPPGGGLPAGGGAAVAPGAAGPAVPRVVPHGGAFVVDEPFDGGQLGDPVTVPAGTVLVHQSALVVLNGQAVKVRFL